MAIVDLTTLKVGQTISFETLDPRDTFTWEGDIAALASYDVVKGMADLVPTYQALKKVVPGMAPIDKLNYLILTIRQNDKSSTKILAREWLEPTSVKIVDRELHFDIRIYNRGTAERQTVLDLLASHGYTVAAL